MTIKLFAFKVLKRCNYYLNQTNNTNRYMDNSHNELSLQFDPTYKHKNKNNKKKKKRKKKKIE